MRTKHPNGVHHRCRDWAAEPWPKYLVRRQKELRRLWRALTRLVYAEAAGPRLQKAERSLPADARAVVDAERESEAKLKAMMREVGEIRHGWAPPRGLRGCRA